ncbi:hypothetical protein H257_18526 [Aphanomyces astaci]|uniref:Uncharacterized protein n=1 Tax=Aphanomyces astaci TaxID=112090 RepID=W4FCJ0_APHAT|nr:hypothetical protein H257_18526 [Aphanomyces astaci]ETV64604.1 hypothetical protein H257_18526 [Aphanomyces astaci]|eukprot:XP_009845912.1 hypothetical protein H257_18526 [Aphanomyces astaci]
MVRLVRSWMKHLLEFLAGSQHFLQGRTMPTISNRGPGIHPTSTDDANDTTQEEAPAGINGRQLALPRRRQLVWQVLASTSLRGSFVCGAAWCLVLTRRWRLPSLRKE